MEAAFSTPSTAPRVPGVASSPLPAAARVSVASFASSRQGAARHTQCVWPALSAAVAVAVALPRRKRGRWKWQLHLQGWGASHLKQPSRGPTSLCATEGGAGLFDELPADEVEVVTYNVLSSYMSRTNYYWHNDEKDLNQAGRLSRVQLKLLPLIQRGAVICLQECSPDWSGTLHAFFQGHGYHLITSHYYRHFGVAIAFPTKRYDLEEASIQRVSEAKPWVDPKRLDPKQEKPQVPSGPGARRKEVFHKLLDAVSYFGSPFMIERGLTLAEKEDEDDDDSVAQEIDPWEFAKTRHHTLVAVKLRPRKAPSEQFVVATYHMPCAFWSQQVMVIHTALAAQYAYRFAKGLPLLLAGDFNFKPGAAPYTLLTRGTLSEDNPSHPGHPPGDAWRIDQGLQEMRSAYAERNPGGEPEFTNYAWVKDDTDPFVGTLDYIFLSKQVEVLSTGRLPRLQECPSPLPSRNEPSDHLMLSAKVRPYGRQKGAKKAVPASVGVSRPSSQGSPVESRPVGGGFAMKSMGGKFGAVAKPRFNTGLSNGTTMRSRSTGAEALRPL